MTSKRCLAYWLLPCCLVSWNAIVLAQQARIASARQAADLAEKQAAYSGVANFEQTLKSQGFRQQGSTFSMFASDGETRAELFLAIDPMTVWIRYFPNKPTTPPDPLLAWMLSNGRTQVDSPGVIEIGFAGDRVKETGCQLDRWISIELTSGNIISYSTEVKCPGKAKQ